MKFNIGPPKADNTEILPKHQQVIITLETQKEIDQLYAMINFVPIIEAVDLRKGDWISLRENLSSTPIYNTWHEKLSKMLRK
jgi:hypothetical protein